MSLRRREALALLGAGAASPALAAAQKPDPKLTALEARTGNRIGLAVLDTGSGRRLGHRAGVRFPLCSTFKLLAAAAILHRVDTDCEDLGRKVAVRQADILSNSPLSEQHVGEAVTLGALCEAAVTLSDNTAANYILMALGGPQGVTGFARSIGDKVTRLDRRETALNEVGPHDPRDTTTPDAMLADLQKLTLGAALRPASRERLTGWLVANKTGGACLRAGVPADWKVGDKTGAWVPNGGVSDVAILWPPRRAPILAAAYTYGGPGDLAERRKALAEIGRIVARRFG